MNKSALNQIVDRTILIMIVLADTAFTKADNLFGRKATLFLYGFIIALAGVYLTVRQWIT